MPSAVSARSLRCCAIRSLGTAADRPPVSSAPVVFIFWPSISISSGIKRFQPDKMLILVVSSGQRPFLPDVFWFGARSLVFSSVATPVARVPSKGSLSLIVSAGRFSGSAIKCRSCLRRSVPARSGAAQFALRATQLTGHQSAALRWSLFSCPQSGFHPG